MIFTCCEICACSKCNMTNRIEKINLLTHLDNLFDSIQIAQLILQGTDYIKATVTSSFVSLFYTSSATFWANTASAQLSIRFDGQMTWNVEHISCRVTNNVVVCLGSRWGRECNIEFFNFSLYVYLASEEWFDARSCQIAANNWFWLHYHHFGSCSLLLIESWVESILVCCVVR